jgi:hypothetical protein
VVCLKAMCQLSIEQGLDNPFHISRNGNIDVKGAFDYWHMDPDDQRFLTILCVAYQFPTNLDITPLPWSDRMWMAHVHIPSAQGQYRPRI